MPSDLFMPMTIDGYRMSMDSNDYEICLGHRFSSFYSTTIGEPAQRVFKKNSDYLMAFTANAASMLFACSGIFLEE